MRGWVDWTTTPFYKNDKLSHQDKVVQAKRLTEEKNISVLIFVDKASGNVGMRIHDFTRSFKIAPESREAMLDWIIEASTNPQQTFLPPLEEDSE
jgi:hypothetical protein